MDLGGLRWILQWASVRRILHVLRPAWFATFIVVVVGVVFDLAQTADVLSDVRNGANDWTPKQIALFVGVLTLSAWAWYFPRALLSVSYWNTPSPNDPTEATRFNSFRKWYPRFLGLAPYITLSVAFFRGGRPYVALAYLGAGALFLATLILRRKSWLKDAPVHTEKASIDNSTFIILLGIGFAALVLLWAFMLSRVGFPQILGAASIVLYAAAAWVAFGSLILVHLTYRYSLPSLTFLLLVFTIVFGFFNDNHTVRKGVDQRPISNQQAIRDHFTSWLHSRSDLLRDQTSAYPVYIIAAEGGGIRAAYWTASVLAKLEDENPGFACHIYAISGVSGGSIGAAVFTATIAERLRSGQAICSENAVDRPGPTTVEIVRDVLRHDFLAPAIAGLLFPDLMQKLLPVAVLPDRAVFFEESLEQGWAAGWEAATRNKSQIFEQNFEDLWHNDPQQFLPSLFLNATWVDTGSRAIVSNLDIEADDFMHAEGILPLLGYSIPLSTAVHLSARFPYISPPATLKLKENRYGYVVDGGYVDNLGGRTAADILAILKKTTRDLCTGSVNKSAPGTCPKLAFIPIIITNDHANLNLFKPHMSEKERQQDLCPKQPRPNALMREVWAPIDTLFQSRSARGYMEERTLQFLVNQSYREVCTGVKGKPQNCTRLADSEQFSEFHRFALGEILSKDVLLGWMLADKTRTAINTEIDNHHMRFSGLLRGERQYSRPMVTPCHHLE